MFLDTWNHRFYNPPSSSMIMATAVEQKDKIFAFIQTQGPNLPVKISAEIKSSPLFASAFLSELYGERRVKISNIRVGSSPLYYIPGQEAQLENFVQHLNQRERDAFLLIKDKKVLDDEKQTPVMRVALRAIADFAIPTRIRIGNEQKLFWKYHLLSDTDATNMISSVQKPETKKEEIAESPSKEKDEPSLPKEEKPVRPAEVKQTETQIGPAVRSYLERKNLVLISVIAEKRKEFHARVHSISLFGPQHFYLVAKDKKKVSASDIESLIEYSEKEKMPGIFLCPGEPDKKALSLLNEWANLIKFEKISV